MDRTIRINRAECIPDASRVCHYDELDESTKEAFPTLVADDAAVNPDHVRTLIRYDYVKFTDYYRISIEDGVAGTCGMD